MTDEDTDIECELCKRLMKCTKHHLIPRELHGRKQLKKNYTLEELNRTIDACQPCHSTVHHFFTNKELAYEYNTIDKLMADEEFASYIEWISKRPGHVPKTVRSNRRRKKGK